MKPITFACHETLPLALEEIAEQILDVSKWPDFRGYRPIPGIKSAEFETRTPNVVGSRIRVAIDDESGTLVYLDLPEAGHRSSPDRN